MTTRETLTPNDVRQLLDTGIDPANIAARLIATGAWSADGANEIIRFLTHGPDAILTRHLPLPDGRVEKHARQTLTQPARARSA